MGLLKAVGATVEEGTEAGETLKGGSSASVSSPKSKKSAVEVGTIFARSAVGLIPVTEGTSNKSDPLPIGVNMEGLREGEISGSARNWLVGLTSKGFVTAIGIEPEIGVVPFVV